MKISKMLITIDSHTAGTPTRTLVGGLPHIPGKTMVEKMEYIKGTHDNIRTLLVYEPRGHIAMAAAILTEPCNPEADIGVIFMETLGYLPMCGTDTVGVCTVLAETGMISVVEPESNVILDTPAGLVKTRIRVKNGKAKSVTLRNVPAFLHSMDVDLSLPELGGVKVDIAYGGNWFAIASADELGIEISRHNTQTLVRYAKLIGEALNGKIEVRHPEKSFIKGIHHVQFSTKLTSSNANVKNNVVILPYGLIDRSPCGTGTCAKMATLYARGELQLGDEFLHEGIIGTLFRGKLIEECKVGHFRAVVPEVTGTAYITGMHQFVTDEEDPLRDGFLLNSEPVFP